MFYMTQMSTIQKHILFENVTIFVYIHTELIQSSMVFLKSTRLAPPKAHSVQQGIHHICSG